MTEGLSVEQAAERARAVEDAANRVLVGQQEVVREVLVALVAGGHVLLEGMPGLGKTLLVRTLARSLSVEFGRIQFTPDLMPTDVTGHALYDPRSEQFRIRKGPAFTSLLLADEINRASAKTQAALLEVMQERQITIEGRCFPLEQPFMVMATQNPLDQEGTYPLPEAQLDRFLFKVLIGYPSAEQEARVVRMMLDGTIDDALNVEGLEPVTDAAGVRELQRAATAVAVDDEILRYILALVRATRALPGLARGAGPRASIAIAATSRAHALIGGRDFVVPDDVKTVAAPVLRHRIQLSADAEIEGQDVEALLARLLDQVPAPRR